jgi:chemotaxis protein methyltransferase CheR
MASARRSRSSALSPTGNGQDLERFRVLVARRLGLGIDEARLGALAELLARRLEATGASSETYLRQLAAAGSDRAETQALAAELTVAETYFFRNADQFRAFGDRVLPERMGARAAERKLAILSAGCASGEEAYSLAMAARELLGAAPGWALELRAADVNPAMLERARQARYSAWSLRETPAELRRRWFLPKGRDFTLADEVIAMVRFEERNLCEDDPALWQPEAFDVVFCRNVIMYFTPTQAHALVGRIARSLRPGGFLFLGHAETLRSLSQDFELCHTHDTFYYQRKERCVATLAPRCERPRQGPGPATEPLAALGGGASWVEMIANATERIRALAEAPNGSAAERPPGAALAATPADERRDRAAAPMADATEPTGAAADRAACSALGGLGRATELLRTERFAEALTLVRALPAESARDPEVILLRAVLLTHRGELEAAEAECAELLAVDGMNAGAHYLVALCREGAGDRQGARDHDQMAAYLNPCLAMPRLHLGLMAVRDGETQLARRELEQALVLLEREEPSRLLLYGGGFSRGALVALCCAQLAACRGAP